MKKIFASSLILFVLFLQTAPAHAETVMRAGESISLAVDQTVNGDFYGISTSGGPISLSGTIEGDAYVIGSSVTANGSIEADLMAIGGTAQVHASVTDDVRIIAGEVTIAEYVGGDVLVLSGLLTVLSSATIDGDLFFYGGEGEVNGTVKGSVYGASEAMRIDGPVGGNVDVKVASNLVLGDRADVSGDVRYESRSELTRAQNAVVVGNVVKNSPSTKSTNPKDSLVPLLIYAFSVLLIFVLFRKHLPSLLNHTLQNFTRSGLIGLGGFVLGLAAILISIVTVLGAVIGMLSMFSLMVLYASAFLMSGILLGLFLRKQFTHAAEVSLLWTLIGIAAVQALLLIPVVGVVIVLVLTLAVAGTILERIYRFLT